MFSSMLISGPSNDKDNNDKGQVEFIESDYDHRVRNTSHSILLVE